MKAAIYIRVSTRTSWILKRINKKEGKEFKQLKEIIIRNALMKD